VLPAHAGNRTAGDSTANALTKLRIDSGFEASWTAKSDALDFAAERLFPVETAAESAEKPESGDTSEPLVVVEGRSGSRPSIKMFLRRDNAESDGTPHWPSFVRVESSSLSLHEFTYRPAKKTLVQHLSETLEINFSLGTDHQLDPGHYDERLPSVGLLFERRFR
jgi:hypothetical protein